MGKIEQYEKSNKRWSGTRSQVPLPHHEGTPVNEESRLGMCTIWLVLNMSLWPLWTSTACVWHLCVYLCWGVGEEREEQQGSQLGHY